MGKLSRVIAAVALAILVMGVAMPAASAGKEESTASTSSLDPDVDVYRSAARFYPTVEDGYKDRVWIDGDVYGDATYVSLEIRYHGSWTPLRSWSVSDSFSIRWDGRDDSGRKLGVGTYDVEACATGWTTSDCDSTTIEIDRGTRTLKRWIVRDGVEDARRSKSGNCNWGRVSGRGMLSTCMDGSATVVYRATAPRGYEVASVRSYAYAGVWSCKNDRFSKSISGRNVVATFSHHGGAWQISQCEIYGIEVSATKTVRI